MPIKIQKLFPGKKGIWKKKTCLLWDENRAMHQDIRPIHIGS